MRLSYIIVTHNRRERLLQTLDVLHQVTDLPREAWEIHVVDNASTDGTVEAVRERFPRVQVMIRPENEGVFARSHAFAIAKGRYLVLLDDDSYPVGDAVIRSMAHLDVNPATAAVVGRVVLPDGTFEASAMPGVMLSGAVCIRSNIFDQLEGFRREFFRKAGEYDLSFRIWQAGLAIERFEDVVYRHDKYLNGRSDALAHRMDLRNNLILVERYLPRMMRRIYRHDWLRRYAALALAQGHSEAITQAIQEARAWARRECDTGRQVLFDETLESLFAWREQEKMVSQWASQHGVRRVLIADYSKNIYATYRACRNAGQLIVAVADENDAYQGMSYRGVPILKDDRAMATTFDGVVVSNINPAQIDRRMSQLESRLEGPILRLWHPRQLGSAGHTVPAPRIDGALEVA